MLPAEERSRSAQVETIIFAYPLIGTAVFVVLLAAVPGLEPWLGAPWHWWLWLLFPAGISASITAAVLTHDRTRGPAAVLGLSLLAGAIASMIYGPIAWWLVVSGSG